MSQEMKSQSGDTLRRNAAEPQSGQQQEAQTEQREPTTPRPPERKRYYPKH